MSVYPQELLELVRAAATRHPDSIENAVDDAFNTWRAHPHYEDHVSRLVRGMVQELIYRERVQANVAIRRAAGSYVQPGKVSIASAAVNAVATECYLNYFIAGRALGSIRGDELPAISEAERERANGHDFNARLCDKLASLVTRDRTVGECVSEQRLKRIFRELRGQRNGGSDERVTPIDRLPSSGPGAVAARKKQTAAAPA